MKVKSIAVLLIITLCFGFAAIGCTPDNPSEGKPNGGTKITVTVGSSEFSLTLADNETAKAFKDLLPLTLNMSELNGNEKYDYLSGGLPTNAVKPGTIHAGDLMLYGSNCVVLFYKTFSSSYSYTRIGWVDDVKGLATALGGGSVTVKFEVSDTSPNEDEEKSEQPESPEQPEDPNGPEDPETPEGPNGPEQSETPEEPSKPEKPEQPNQEEEISTMYITINGKKSEISLEKNSSAAALVGLLKEGDITYTASDYGGFEKVGGISHTLPTNHTSLTTQPGDVILYQTNQIVLFYGSNSWSAYTKLGKIKYSSLDDLKSFLGAGEGSVQITLSLK